MRNTLEEDERVGMRITPQYVAKELRTGRQDQLVGRNLVSVTTDKGDIKELLALKKQLKARTVIIWFRLALLKGSDVMFVS